MAVYRPNGFIEEEPQLTKSTDVFPSTLASPSFITPPSFEVQEPEPQLARGRPAFDSYWEEFMECCAPKEEPQLTKSNDLFPSPLASASLMTPGASYEEQEPEPQLARGRAVYGVGGLITAETSPQDGGGPIATSAGNCDSPLWVSFEIGEGEGSDVENNDEENYDEYNYFKSVSQQSHNENLDQPQLQPIQCMSPVDIVQQPTENTVYFPSDGNRYSLLLASPRKGSPQPSHEWYATNNCYLSPGSASSSETSLCPDSDESSNFLEDDDGHLVVLHSKHLLLVDLMQEVYAIFDQRWAANVQGHVGSSDPTTPPTNQNRKSDSSRKGKKRCRDDRDFTPPNDGGSRKRPSNEIPSNTEKQNDPFACPFHKHEPAKYCCSVIDGSRYRACVGPGFATIARLK
ncbi:MAG: hypothetical protein HETSPECPRED_007934 [Heterodermia speciosa]|uniref:Uncharacterized protein n=1 Tax=Heterodermia speciosa TaxID=116794 RepID=A0A8H3EPM5_9LECA|nr:MAG: hypothetical protein HETSPECPRED_007934 [Heterodermia speciosa]